MFPPCLVDEEQLLHVMAVSVRHRIRGDRMAASKRNGNYVNDDRSYIRKDINGTICPGLSGHDFSFGDIAWVKSGTSSWWPAQVVDEKSVGKSRKKAEGGVIVRLYGTHNYLCIDPVKNNEEFEHTMKQNNSSIREMFEKALKEDLSRIKSHREIKGNPPSIEVKTGWGVRQNRDGKLKTKQQDLTKLEQDEVKEGKVKGKGIQGKKPRLAENAQNEAIKDDSERKSKQKDVSDHDVCKSAKHSQVGKTPDASARRMKVMQTLALIPPSGSPFCKNGHVIAAPHEC